MKTKPTFNLKEILFSRKESIEDILSNSLVSCANLVKCMEFYTEKGCDNDLDHWIDVATSNFNKMLSPESKSFGGYLIFSSLSKEFINKNYKLGMLSFSKYLVSIKDLKHNIEIAKEGGKLKYYSILEKDSLGRVIWKHSDKYYETFFKILGYLLNFQISLNDLYGIGISEDGKVWGGRIVPNKPILILDSKIDKYNFQNLIYGYIYLMNYEQFNKNLELRKRLKGKI